MSEGKSDMQQYADQFEKRAVVAAEANEPFSVAEGVAKTAGHEATESKIEANQSVINYERAQTELSMSGASESVIEAGNVVIDALSKATKWFGERLQDRGGKLLKRADRQQKISKAVEEKRKLMVDKQFDQQVENARLKEVAPHLKASRGIWGETGGRVLEWAGVKVQEITIKPYVKIASWGNHLEATVLNTAGDVLKDGAEFVTNTANEVKKKVLDKASKRTADAQTKVDQLSAVKDQKEGYADFTQNVKANVVQEKYFMPDAATAGRTIKQAGGDSDHSTAESFEAQIVNRATTST